MSSNFTRGGTPCRSGISSMRKSYISQVSKDGPNWRQDIGKKNLRNITWLNWTYSILHPYSGWFHDLKYVFSWEVMEHGPGNMSSPMSFFFTCWRPPSTCRHLIGVRASHRTSSQVQIVILESWWPELLDQRAVSNRHTCFFCEITVQHFFRSQTWKKYVYY